MYFLRSEIPEAVCRLSAQSVLSFWSLLLPSIELSEELGYASNMKEYKENPDKFKGNVADVSTVIRVAVTTSSQTPDLYEILKLLGKDRIVKRINLI